MSKSKITAEVTINYPEGKKKIDMELKKPMQLEECPEETTIMLILVDGQELTGYFKGMSDEDVKIQSLDRKHTLGYNIWAVSEYFEEIKKK